ncbi:MAG: ankyrin repeat domain-containing protein [bacterium]
MPKFKFIIFLILTLYFPLKLFPILKYRIQTEDFSYLKQLENGKFQILIDRILELGIPNLIFNEYDGSFLYYVVLLDKDIIQKNTKLYKKLLKTLIKMFVDYTIKDKFMGKTPIHYAVMNRNYDALHVFCKYLNSMALNVQDIDRDTPLHLALKIIDHKSIGMLTDAGVDMKIKNNSGITAMDLIQKLNIAAENDFENGYFFKYFDQITNYLKKIKEDCFNLFKTKSEN